MEKMVIEVYGKENLFMIAQCKIRKAQIYAEIKGEEYKSEDNLKEYAELHEKLYN